jgi:hypothetical protein
MCQPNVFHSRVCNWFATGFRTLQPQCTYAFTDGPFVPHFDSWEPCYLAKVLDGPILILLMSSGSKRKESSYTCLSEAKASHLQWLRFEVSSSAAHLLHNGLFMQSPQNIAAESGIHSLACWDRCFVLPQLLHRLWHQSRIFWIPPCILGTRAPEYNLN